MATIVTRIGKGSPLTTVEVDANFTNLNVELGTKAPLNSPTFTGPVIAPSFSGDGTSLTGTAAALNIGGNAATATTATKATTIAISNDATTATSVFLNWTTANTGDVALKVTSTKLSFVPSTGALSAISFVGSGAALTGTATALNIGGNAATATQASNTATITIADDTTTATSVYLNWTSATAGNLSPKVTSSRLTFVPSTGALSATSFIGSGASLTGTASALSIGGNAATATTAAACSGNSVTATTATNLSSFVPTGLTDIGRYIDFHGAANGFDYDVRLDGQAGGTNGAGVLAITANGGVSSTGPFIGSLTGNASTATSSNAATAKWFSASIAGHESTAGAASAEFRNNGGTGGANMASIAFLAQGTYGIHLGLRNDGIFAIGGYSRPAYSWYTDASGNMIAAGNVTAYSDPRLKENIIPIINAMDIVKSLNGVRFNWKQGIKHTVVKNGKQDVGVLANEVEAVLPELITNSVDIEGEIYKTVCYEKLTPVLIQAMKEQQTEIESLSMLVKQLMAAIDKGNT